jgi:hypothetical protein
MTMFFAKLFEMFIIAKPMFITSCIPWELQMIQNFHLISCEVGLIRCFLIYFEFLALGDHPII